MLKKTQYILILFIMGITCELFSHPMHLTLTNIEIEGDSIKVSIRLNRDDIESAILGFNHKTAATIQSDTLNLVPENIKIYIIEHFKISDESGILNVNFYNNRVDESSLWIYLGGRINLPITALTIENTLLNNLHGDQRNLVVISCNNKEEGIEFDDAETKKTISLRN